MKKLELNQMENLNSGNALWACAAVPAIATIGIVGAILTGGLFGVAAFLAVSAAVNGKR